MFSKRTLLIILAGVAGLTAVASSPVDPPDQIHLTLTVDPCHEMLVQWHTPGDEGMPIVDYGESPHLGIIVGGTIEPSPNGGAGFIRRVKITGLSPSTTYFYAVGSDIGGWSSISGFRTAPDKAADYVIVAYGDQGVDDGAPDVAAAVTAANPDLVLILGDLSYADGGDPQIWDQWFNLIQPHARKAATLSVLGNHDAEEDLDTYLGRFTLPMQERWYAVTVGAIRIFALDSFSDFQPGSAQHTWLSEGLDAASQNPGIKWIIAMIHHAPFTSSTTHPEDGDDERLHLAPLFEQYGVDLVLAAHEHHYERSYPITAGGEATISDGNVFKDPEGTVYMVSGGGGNGLYDTFTFAPPSWSAHREAYYGFTKITFTTEDAMKVEYHRTNGAISDTFTIRKPRPPLSSPVTAPDAPRIHSRSRCGLIGLEAALPFLAVALFRRKRRRS